MRLSVERLSAEVLDHIKKWYAKCEEADCMPENGLTIGRLLDTIEAQQQEIDRLKATLDDWKYNTKCDADHIAALTADKDEQAGTIMRLANGLKKLRSSLQWLKETIHDLDYKAWAEDNIGKIDALLGGKEE